MKIRTGFVSNSSSSSFCIIGISNQDIIFKLMKKDGFPTKQEKETVSRYDGAGRMRNPNKYRELCEKAPLVEVLDIEHVGGSHGFYEKMDRKETQLIYLGGDQPEYAGLQAERLLQNKSITQAKKDFRNYVKNWCEIDIPEEQIELYYGEVSS